MKCFAQGNNTVTPAGVSLEQATHAQEHNTSEAQTSNRLISMKHSTTKLL